MHCHLRQPVPPVVPRSNRELSNIGQYVAELSMIQRIFTARSSGKGGGQISDAYFSECTPSGGPTKFGKGT